MLEIVAGIGIALLGWLILIERRLSKLEGKIKIICSHIISKDKVHDTH
jgi:hypothetical protein